MAQTWPGLSEDVEREGVIGTDDTVWSSFLPRGAACARAVGRVCWAAEPAETRSNGTGFLVAESLLLTNHHVLDSEQAAAESEVEFGFEYDHAGRESAAEVLALEPQRLFLTDPALDFTVVAVAPSADGTPPGRRLGCLPLIARTGKVRNGEPLNLIHHPAGARKKVTIRESRLLAMAETTLSYSGDTLGGSSGAPVLNDQWEVVALHFGGKPCRDTRRRPLTVNGELWTPGMPESLKAYEFNVGSRVSRIVASLKTRRPRNPERKALLDSLRAAGSPVGGS